MNEPAVFHVLVAANKAKDHLPMIAAAPPFFAQLGAKNGFMVTFTDDGEAITDEMACYDVFVQLQRAPFELTTAQQTALQTFIENGKGWVGIHAAGLTGKNFQSPDRPYWQWFEDLLGGITYSPHPAYQKGTVIVEDRQHPATQNLPATFEVSDEWYEFNESPRGRVRVLATADESTYTQNKPMGDHPIIWTNEAYRRAIYIGIGHDPYLFTDPAFCILLRDSILWAAS